MTGVSEAAPTEEEPSKPRWRRVIRPGLFASAAYVFLALSLYPRIWRDPANVTTCACGDHGLFMFWIGWMRWALDHAHNPFLTTHISIPDGVNALWNTSIPLPAALMAPITDRWGPVASLNVLLISGPALSGMTMYAALRRWARPMAAFAGGLVYGFSPFMAGHLIGHLHLTLIMIPPLLLLVADEILVRQRRSPAKLGALFGLLLVAQLFTGEEVLATGAVTGLVGVLVLALRYRSEVRARWRYAAKAFGVAITVFAVLAGGPLVFQFTGPRHISGPAQRIDYGIDPVNLVVPTTRTKLHNETTIEISKRFPGNIAERGGYIGIPIVIAFAVALVRHRRDRVAGFAAISALPIVVLSFGKTLEVGGADTGFPLPGRLLASLPAMDSIIFTRFALFTTLFAAIVVARLLDGVPGWRPFRRIDPRIAIVPVAMLLLVPIAPKTPLGGSAANIPKFFTSDEVQRIPEASVALVAPYAYPQDARPMVWQAAAGMRFRMPGGYAIQPWADGIARFRPESTVTSGILQRLRSGTQTAPLPDNMRDGVIRDMRRWGVRSVIVGPMPNRYRVVDAMTGVLRRPPIYTGGVAVWFDVDPTKL